MRIDALGIMQDARLRKLKPIQGLAEPAAYLRDRIGKAEAILAAGRDNEACSDTFRAGCARLLAEVHEMRRAWVGAFGRDWHTGEPVPIWKRPDTVNVRLMQSAYVCHEQLRFHRGWVKASNVAERIHRAEQRELGRPAMEAAARAAAERARVEADRLRRQRTEAQRQEAELEAFRAGTLRFVKFPDERRPKQKVRSRWG